jgi:hypothetical protein
MPSQYSARRRSWLRGWALGALLAVPRPVHAAEGPASSDPIENTAGVDLAPWGPDAFEAPRQAAEGEDGDARDDRGALGVGARRPGLWLGVSGGMAVASGERERVFGLLELGVSLDEWFGGGAAASAAFEVEAADDPGADGDLDADPAETPPPAAAGARPLAPFALSTVLATPALARPTLTAAFASPALVIAPASAPPRPRAARSLDPAASAALARAAVSEALRLQGSGAELRRLDSMASRSRAAASLPEVRLGAGTSRDESMRLSPTLSDPAHFSRDGGRDLWLEARLIWRLDGAIFSRDEIAIMRLRAQRQQGAAQLAREVVEALLDWQRARLLLASPLSSPEELDAATVRHFGAVARLDVFTDGWFSRQLARWGATAP